ncbi:MAG: hypothetical protein ACOVK9_03405 [Bacteroidia bacterium]
MNSVARLKKTMASLGFIFIFLHTIKPVYAQSVSAYLGSSIPYGLYGSKDIYNTSAGMALNGRSISLLIEDDRSQKKFQPYIQWMYNTNDVDENVLTKIYQYNYRTIQAFQAWSQNILLGGAKANYFGESFNLFVKGGLGFGWMRTHGFNIYTDSSGVIKFNPLQVNAFVLIAGLGTNIYLKQNLSLSLGYDFLFAKNNFGYEKYSNANGPVPAAVAVEVKPDFMIGNFYLGLKFNLGSSRKK